MNLIDIKKEIRIILSSILIHKKFTVNLWIENHIERLTKCIDLLKKHEQ